MTLPQNLIARTLNAKTRRVERGRRKNAIPRIHVSSLIKSGSQDFFCEKEFVLRHIEQREAEGAGLPPKFALLYEVGHFYGDYIVREFIDRNPEYAKYVWGDWRCNCGETVVKRSHLPLDSKCQKCKSTVQTYVETDLFEPKKRVIGHADLIFLKDGMFTIYEFKSIERADIVFDQITEPLGDHLLQASNYFYMLKSEGHRVDPVLRFVYVDRSMAGLYTDMPFREVNAKVVAADRLTKIYKRVDTVYSALKSGILPKRKCATIDCSRAKNCSVAISCFSRVQETARVIQQVSTPPSRPLESTSDLLEKGSGMVSRQVRKVGAHRTRTESSTSTKKSRVRVRRSTSKS